MAVRQYIGARYVTKIYENSLDPSSAEWEAGVTYEPLTLVTYLNSSYLSKKDVPGAIGNPAANPDYWVVTGAYNGQIATLQSQVQQLQQDLLDTQSEISGKLRDPKKCKVLIIGDSYLTGDNYGWDAGFINALKLTPDQYRVVRAGGYGFCNSFQPANTFISFLQSIIGTITDKDKYTDIMVCAGANDRADTNANLLQAISDFKDYCLVQFPNADLSIGFIGWGDIATYNDEMTHGIYAYMNACTQLGIRYLHNVQYVLHNYDYLNADDIHPTIAGKDALGYHIAQAFISGSTDVHYFENVFITGGTDALHIEGNTTLVKIDMFNDRITLTFPPYGTAKFESAPPYGQVVNIGTIKSKILRDNLHYNTLAIETHQDNGNSIVSPLMITDSYDDANKEVKLLANFRGTAPSTVPYSTNCYIILPSMTIGSLSTQYNPYS